MASAMVVVAVAVAVGGVPERALSANCYASDVRTEVAAALARARVFHPNAIRRDGPPPPPEGRVV